MAIAAWKRLEKTPGYQRKKRFLKRLIGRELRLERDIEVPVIEAGGWRFTPEGLNRNSIVYSLQHNGAGGNNVTYWWAPHRC